MHEAYHVNVHDPKVLPSDRHEYRHELAQSPDEAKYGVSCTVGGLCDHIYAGNLCTASSQPVSADMLRT